MKKNQLILLCLIALFPFLSYAQDGWSHIENNNFIAAKEAFQQKLKDSPGDESASIGMLFIAETLRDQDVYAQTVHALVAKHPKPEYIWLFTNLLLRQAVPILENPLPESIAIPFKVVVADSLRQHRKFAQANTLAESILPQLNWTITGPFTNIQGSGFLEESPVETAPFARTDSFTNESGQRFTWLEFQPRSPYSEVSFGTLPRPSYLATYYANTFVEVPEARWFDLFISHAEALKIWVDDQLVYQNPDDSYHNQWDADRLRIFLEPGTHRILVKSSDYESHYPQSSYSFNDPKPEISIHDYSSEVGRSYRNNQNIRSYNYFNIRFADTLTGKSIRLKSVDLASYATRTKPFSVVVQKQHVLVPFVQMALENPNDLAIQYLYAKALSLLQDVATGESYFAEYYAKHPGSDFARFLLAKFYHGNGKEDRAESLLSAMDSSQCPSLVELRIRLDKIDVEREEDQFISLMQRVLELSPTNLPAIEEYLDFLKEKGKKEEINAFATSFLTQHPKDLWGDFLDSYLKDESYKPDSYKPMSDKEREKEFKKVRKNLEKYFRYADYYSAIYHYKRKNKSDEVLKLYDEMQRLAPYWGELQHDKAKFLFEEERIDEALEIILNTLQKQPYDDKLLELAGDIYIEKKDEKTALSFYKRINNEGELHYGLKDKMDKLKPPVQLNKYMESFDLMQLARDRSFLEKYQGEESVISFFQIQTTCDDQQKIIETSRKIVLHILTETGAKFWTEAQLGNMGRITSAKVLKKDGSVTSPVLGWQTAVFKNLEPGDCILLEGVTQSSYDYTEIPNELLGLNVYSWDAPVAQVHASLLVSQNTPMYFASHRVNSGPTTVRDTAGMRIYTWNWNDLPKIEYESNQPNNLDNVAWLMYNNLPDWSGVVTWYQRTTYRKLELNYEVLQKSEQLIQPGMSEQEIVETLHNYISKDINYSYVSFINSSYVPKEPGETVAGKVGDCKDVATLMIALLRHHGIDAWYTLVSTHTFSNTAPRPTYYVFNHAIVAYQLSDGVLRFADPTTDFFPSGILPHEDSDAWGLVIRDGESNIRRLPRHDLDPNVSKIQVQTKASLDPNKNLMMQTHMQLSGTAAGNFRESLLRATREDQHKILSEYMSGGVLDHLDLEYFDLQNPEDLNEDLELTLQIRAYNPIDRVLDLQIMPLPILLSTPTDKSFFAPKRYCDLDLRDALELIPIEEEMHFQIPEGLQLAELPADKKLESPFGSYQLRFEQTADQLTIRRSVRLANRFIPYQDFEAFKDFYLQMLNTDKVLLALRSLEK